MGLNIPAPGSVWRSSAEAPNAWVAASVSPRNSAKGAASGSICRVRRRDKEWFLDIFNRYVADPPFPSFDSLDSRVGVSGVGNRQRASESAPATGTFRRTLNTYLWT